MHELVDRHQLDRRHPEVAKVVDHGRVGDTGVGAPLLVGDVGVELGEPLDVRLVDDGFGVRDVESAVAGPVEERVDDDAEHHVRRRVVVVDLIGVAEVVREQRRIPVDVAMDGLRVGIQQQLGGLAR